MSENKEDLFADDNKKRKQLTKVCYILFSIVFVLFVIGIVLSYAIEYLRNNTERADIISAVIMAVVCLLFVALFLLLNKRYYRSLLISDDKFVIGNKEYTTSEFTNYKIAKKIFGYQKFVLVFGENNETLLTSKGDELKLVLNKLKQNIKISQNL